MASVPSSWRAFWIACSTELAKYDLILMETAPCAVAASSDPP
jgi:hypothetical protein